MEGLEEKVNGGNFIDKAGKVLGQQRIPFYTIGQRKGLDIALGKPAFVTGIIPETNTVVLGDEEDLNRSEMKVAKVNWIKYDGITEGMEAITKIRYKDKGAPQHPCTHTKTVLMFVLRIRKGYCPGQSAVFMKVMM